MMSKQLILQTQRLAVFTALLAGLQGCTGSDVSRAFGLERSMPDEYTVITQRPLSMPPGSNDLNAPGQGGRPSGDTSSVQALETLAPEMALRRGVGEESSGQKDLVKDVDQAVGAQPSGQEINGVSSDHLTDAILFWKKSAKDVVVDGEAENRRIRDASAFGRNPASGATPAKSASKGFLGLF